MDVSEGIAVVTLNRPAARNALNREMCVRLPAALLDVEARHDVDVIVLTGADPAFCAGMDLVEAERGETAATPPDVLDMSRRDAGGRFPFRGPFPPLTKPLIGAINGVAVTGGFELALACDYLVASERARFVDTHARFGVMPGWGLTVMLSQAVGVRRARELSTTCRFLGAEEGLAWGLVNHVVAHDELLPFTRSLAASIVTNEAASVRRMLVTYREISGTTIDDAWEIEGEVARGWRGGGFDPAVVAGERAATDAVPSSRVRTGRRAVKVDGGLGSAASGAVETLRDRARALEAAGYAGLWSSETNHDPFIPLAVAAEHTQHIEIGTSIVVAFARNPMTVVYAAHDLQTLSRGRFVLGLGSQVKAHIQRRFSMPWSHPAARMREFVAAVRAIWCSWDDGTPLDFSGDFYSHSLMPPVFVPGPGVYGAPRIVLAAVGERMTEVAGEVADGVLLHSFTSPSYLRDHTWPALRRGMDQAAPGKEDTFEATVPVFIATATTEEQMDRAVRAVRGHVAFYGSTPAYAGVLEHHGWGALQADLQVLAKQGRWDDMAGLVDDEVLHTFAVVAEPSRVADVLLERYGTLVQRVAVHPSYDASPELWDGIASDLAFATPCLTRPGPEPSLTVPRPPDGVRATDSEDGSHEQRRVHCHDRRIHAGAGVRGRDTCSGAHDRRDRRLHQS